MSAPHLTHVLFKAGRKSLVCLPGFGRWLSFWLVAARRSNRIETQPFQNSVHVVADAVRRRGVLAIARQFLEPAVAEFVNDRRRIRILEHS